MTGGSRNCGRCILQKLKKAERELCLLRGVWQVVALFVAAASVCVRDRRLWYGTCYVLLVDDVGVLAVKLAITVNAVDFTRRCAGWIQNHNRVTWCCSFAFEAGAGVTGLDQLVVQGCISKLA